MILLQLIIQAFWIIVTIVVLLSAPTIEAIRPGLTAVLWAGIMILQMHSMTGSIGTMALLLKKSAEAELFLRVALMHQTLNARLPVRLFTMEYLYTAQQLVMALVDQQKYKEALQISLEMLTMSEERPKAKTYLNVRQAPWPTRLIIWELHTQTGACQTKLRKCLNGLSISIQIFCMQTTIVWP